MALTTAYRSTVRGRPMLPCPQRYWNQFPIHQLILGSRTVVIGQVLGKGHFLRGNSHSALPTTYLHITFLHYWLTQYPTPTVKESRRQGHHCPISPYLKQKVLSPV